MSALPRSCPAPCDDAGARPHADAGDDAPARILVAEDNAQIRSAVARALTRDGFLVEQAEDGGRALALAIHSPPDIAIVDLRMPEVDGWTVVRLLKRRYAEGVSCLVVSGTADLDDRMHAFEDGADDFIAKPVCIPELLKRVQAFERTRRAMLALRRANDSADRLRLFAAETSALLAHDLNNGLSIATANLQFLEEELSLDPDCLDALQAASRALRRMTGLVRNFVDIARMEDAALKATRVRVDVHELLTAAAALHEARSSQRQRDIVIDCKPGLTADIDPVLVERVIHNLLNNARRYVAPDGHIGMRARLYDDPVRGRSLMLSVGNIGPMIPPALRASLFAKYRTGSDGKAQRGMGLYFCRLACEAHGGDISLQRDPEFPTNFVLQLPLAQRQQQHHHHH